MDDRSPSASIDEQDIPRPFDPETDHIVTVTLDPYTIAAVDPDEMHEWRVAIYDLIERNRFYPDRVDIPGPYALHLSIVGNYVLLDVRHPDSYAPIVAHYLSLTPLRGLIRDYFRIREAYYDAIKSASPHQIETVDMGRRGMHNEAATLLCERLKNKLVMDHETARDLFTLICAIQPYAARVDPTASKLPTVLFVCALNSVRSPMAAALARKNFPGQLIARSAGVRGGKTDGFVREVMEEIGIDMSVHTPHTLDELGAMRLDLVITLSDEAREGVTDKKLLAHQVEHWPTPDPTISEGSRDVRLGEYRALRDTLDARIRERLRPLVTGGSQTP